jgi:RNA polymerase sigma-70 factor (ECF subfamily)
MPDERSGELERALASVHDAAFAWALSCCRWNRDEAEDVLQTAYVKVLDGSARFDGRASFKTWLFAVVHKTALGRRRAWLSFRRRRTADAPEMAAPTTEPAVDRARLRALIAALADRQREILDLVFYHQLTIEEAAGIMGVSLGAARQHYARAKHNLAERLR